MGKYKILFLDIDGTVLNSKSELTNKTKKAIMNLCKIKDVPVILISARMPDAIYTIQNELKINMPIVCYSGALVLDKYKKTLLTTSIDKGTMQKILKLTDGENIHRSIYIGDKWLVEKKDKWCKIESSIIGIPPTVMDFELQKENNQIFNNGANKMLIISDECQAKETYQRLINAELSSVNIYMSKPNYIEIMSKETSKAEAIKKLLDIYNIKQSEVIAIGDNYNDIDMIKFAGMGIAMGNAPEDVKKISNDVTLTNDEDGVEASILKHFYQPY